jgi:hypothetical protein
MSCFQDEPDRPSPSRQHEEKVSRLWRETEFSPRLTKRLRCGDGESKRPLMTPPGNSDIFRPAKPAFFPNRREVLQGGLALAASTFLPGCGSIISTGSNAPIMSGNPQPAPSGPITEASLTVTNAPAGSIGPAFAGLSYEKASMQEPLFTASNENLIGLFKRLGTSVLRIGGNSVDENVWTPNGFGGTPGQIAPSDLAALAAFVKATGWQCLYGINLGGAATGATTPALAAAEVAYAAEQLGSSLIGIEIGNEPDAYGDPGGYFAGNWTLSDFLNLWGQFRSAILASTPAVHITGPAASYNVSGWTIPFGQAVSKNQIDLLTQHYYRANGQSASSTANFLFTPDPTLVAELATLNIGARNIGIPFRMSECNSFYDGGAPGVSDSYASSLWVIDFLFDSALGGSNGTNFHGGGDGDGYTPIADSNGAVVGARPEYYGILFFTLSGQGTLLTTQVAARSLNVTAYAVRTALGGFNLIVVNKDQEQNLQLTTRLPQSASSATLIEMTQLSSGASGPDLTAIEGVTIQGASVGTDGSFSPAVAYTLSVDGSQMTCYVPALSAILIQIV